MRGNAEQQALILSAVTPDQLVPQDHPIRQVKPIVDRALAELSPTFNQMYAQVGRPSIPPEHLLKGCLLIALYSIRSERQFCERLQYDLLFTWFLDLNIMDPAFDPSTFSKNKTRLLEHQVSRQFFSGVLAEARRRNLLSEDHFTVDGTLLEAWASLKSFRPRGGGGPPSSGGGRNPEVNFRPAGAEAGGGNLWLGQNSGRRPEGTLHWSSPQPAVGGVDGGGLQPGTNGEAGIGQLSDSWGGVCPVTGLPGFLRHEAPVTGAR